MGWWFGRILTFEIEADEQPPTLGTVLTDASDGAISCDDDRALVGFAAYGRSIRNAVEPLVDSFGVELFDDGAVIRNVTNTIPVAVPDNKLANSAEGEAVPRLQREQESLRAVPATLRLTYYDPQCDYQTGETRAVAGEEIGSEAQQELAAVLSAADAKSLAQEFLARTWTSRDKLTVRLSPDYIGLEPGSRLELSLSPCVWTVLKTTLDGFVVVAELRPSVRVGGIGVPAEPGRIIPNPDLTTE